MKVFILLAVLLTAWTGPVGAVEPDEILADPVLEKRAREIGKHLRCVVCQNQAIDDSNSDLARDMRVLVRKRLLAGAADDEVIDYMVSRYGDYVLLEPPFKGTTYVLWFAPVAIGLTGLAALVLFYRRRRRTAAETGTEPEAVKLTPAEEKRLKTLLKEDQE